MARVPIVTDSQSAASYETSILYRCGRLPTTKETFHMDLTAIIAIIVTFGTAFGIVYIVMTTRHRERMSMIQRGIDPGTAPRTPEPQKALKDGIQLIAATIGLGCGYVLDYYTDAPSPWVYLAPVFFFIGIAMIVYYTKFGRKRSEG